jgi:hypothetical protein
MLICVLTNIITFTLYLQNRQKLADIMNRVMFIGLIAFYLLSNMTVLLSGWMNY